MVLNNGNVYSCGKCTKFNETLKSIWERWDASQIRQNTKHGQSGETEEEVVQGATPSDHSLKVLDSARDEDANQERYNIGSKSREK